jgi:hypothetical protein
MELLAKVVKKALGIDAVYNFYAPPTLIMLSNEKENVKGVLK